MIKDEIQTILSVLTPLQQRRLKLYMGFNKNKKTYSLRQIARIEGVTRQAVSKSVSCAEQRIKRKLKRFSLIKPRK